MEALEARCVCSIKCYAEQHAPRQVVWLSGIGEQQMDISRVQVLHGLSLAAAVPLAHR